MLKVAHAAADFRRGRRTAFGISGVGRIDIPGAKIAETFVFNGFGCTGQKRVAGA